ncbi:MAG: glycosyltransferase [Patescibacteria group bacterium]|jgi:glycosyltransferase involved in cell wall biosynthesis
MSELNIPLVSIIIATKNEEKNIKNCLRSIKKQTLSKNKIEIIVVDNNSIDKTKKIAKQFTNIVLNYGPERSAQRNFGVLHAKANWILYLDADMILSNHVLDECLTMVRRNKKLIGLYIPEIIIGKSFLSKIRQFERSFYNATAIDAVRFIKKDIFLSVKGFDESLNSAEDWDLDKRLKEHGTVGIIDNPLFHNEKELSLSRYLSKKVYYTKSFEKYISKWGSSDKDIRKQLGFYYRFLGVHFENSKWKKVISHPILSLGVYYLHFRKGLIYLSQKNQWKKNPSKIKN